MKKVLVTLLAIIVMVGALAGVGFAGYQLGLRQGALRAANNTARNLPVTRNGNNNFGFNRMPPMFNYGDGMRNLPRFGPRGFGFGMMRFGRGFGLFFGLRFLIQVAILGFIIWFIYKLLTGWRLSFTPPAAPVSNINALSTPAQVVNADQKSVEESKPADQQDSQNT